MKAPAFDGFLKTTNDGEAQRRQARGQPVNQPPSLGRGSLQRFAGLRCHSLVAVMPVAGDKLSHAIEHRTGRPQAQRRQNGEPGQHAKDMAVCRDDRVFNDMAHDFAAGQHAGIYLLPVRQALPGRVFLTVFQCIADAREMVAELAKAQRNVKHRHTPEHRKRPAQPPHQSPMDGQSHQRGHHHRQAPGHPAVVGFASVEIAAHRQRPRAQAGMDGIGSGQRACLLDQQSEQDGKETHAANDSGA